MDLKKETSGIVLAGVVIGILASLLVFFGNPVNMGSCGTPPEPLVSTPPPRCSTSAPRSSDWCWAAFCWP